MLVEDSIDLRALGSGLMFRLIWVCFDFDEFRGLPGSEACLLHCMRSLADSRLCDGECVEVFVCLLGLVI